MGKNLKRIILIGNGVEDRTLSDTENLFIRMNSAETQLGGEELNYSILKSNINKTLQKKIESACQGFIRPARFITISYRLFQSIQKSQDSQISSREITSFHNLSNVKILDGFNIRLTRKLRPGECGGGILQ